MVWAAFFQFAAESGQSVRLRRSFPFTGVNSKLTALSNRNTPQLPPSQGRDAHFEVCMTSSLLDRWATRKFADCNAPEKGVRYRFGIWLYGRASDMRPQQRRFAVQSSWGEVQRGEALSAPPSGSLFASFLPNSRKEVPARHERSIPRWKIENKEQEVVQSPNNSPKSRLQRESR